MCSEEGSESCACTEEEGICHCKENIEGDKCDQCKPGYWSYPSCDGKHKHILSSLHNIKQDTAPMIVIRVKMINELEAINSVNLQSIICNNDTLRV